MIVTHSFRGYTLTLDSDQIFPDDPGRGAPAVVRSPCGGSGTYDMAINEGELWGAHCDSLVVSVPSRVLEWLDSMFGTVTDFINEHNGGDRQ